MNDGMCNDCNQDKPPFLHKIYTDNGSRLYCTSCLLKSSPAQFCPLCFEVYDHLDFSVICYNCCAMAHWGCILECSASSSSSSSNPVTKFVCPSCLNPNFRFFHLPKGEAPLLDTMPIDLVKQLVAASIISQRSLTEGALLCSRRSEIKAEQAAKADNEAKKALEVLFESTMPDLHPDGDDDDDDDDDGDQEEGKESSGNEQEEGNQEMHDAGRESRVEYSFQLKESKGLFPDDDEDEEDSGYHRKDEDSSGEGSD